MSFSSSLIPDNSIATEECFEFKKDDRFSSMPDHEIWRMFRNGDEPAFVFIYDKFFHILFDYAHRFCKDSGLVKDAIQDLFIEMRNNKKRLGETTSIKFYLFASIRRKVLAMTAGKLRFVRLKNLENYDFDIEVSPEQKIINRQINDTTRTILSKNIESLSSRQKEAVLYYFYEGFSYQQISAIMGFSKVEHVRVLMYRAIKKIRASLSWDEVGR
ncbi:MAG: sigma-70 family RNA polymerase sigma factor [Cyclobacteriaceae bacterium]